MRIILQALFVIHFMGLLHFPWVLIGVEMVSDAQREELRGMMPDYLANVHGVTDLSRAFRCLSPDHEDRHPSMTFDKKTNRVRCWSCDFSADIFELAGVDNGVTTFPEKAAKAAEAVGMRLDGDAMKHDKPWKPKRKKPAPPFPEPVEAGGGEISDAAFQAFAQIYDLGTVIDPEGKPYPNGVPAMAYLQDRGLGDDDITRCGLGFTRKSKEIMPEFNDYEPDAYGYVVIPYWNRDYTKANYAMLRTIPKGESKPRNKEWRPKGLKSPLYREWMLTAGLDTVVVAEGLIDAISLDKMIDRPVMALGGVSMAPRLSSVLYHAPKKSRPGKIVIAMDEDSEGRKAAVQIAHDLDVIGIAHCMMPAYPNGAKDANEWLMARKDVDWHFEEVPQFEGDEYPLVTTVWGCRDER